MGDGRENLDAALGAIDAFVEGSRQRNASLIAAKCRGLMAGYHARWIDDPCDRVISVEQVVEASLWNPVTGRSSRTFTLGGKIDAVAVIDGKTTIVDHKSTSDDIDDPDSPYWRQLAIEGQVSHYMLLEWLNGRKADGAMWDVMRKPSIAPRKLSKADCAVFAAARIYYRRSFARDEIDQFLADADHRETDAMYEARLAHDCTFERPTYYFQRRQVPRLDAEIHEYALALWDNAQEVIHARAMERWPRNSRACLMYGAPCKFLGICSGHDEADSDNWAKKDNIHTELPGLEGDGKSVLTNSRLGTFQTCRRKSYYEHELGIERRDEEEREALYFGSVWHAGLEAWWTALKQTKEGEHVNTSSEASGRPQRSSETSAVVDYF